MFTSGWWIQSFGSSLGFCGFSAWVFYALLFDVQELFRRPLEERLWVLHRSLKPDWRCSWVTAGGWIIDVLQAQGIVLTQIRYLALP